MSRDQGRPGTAGERPTEDDLAQAALGGTRGSPELPDQVMTESRAKKTFGVREGKARPEPQLDRDTQDGGKVR